MKFYYLLNDIFPDTRASMEENFKMSEPIEIKCPHCGHVIRAKNTGAKVTYGIICIGCKKLFVVKIDGAHVETEG